MYRVVLKTDNNESFTIEAENILEALLQVVKWLHFHPKKIKKIEEIS